ncbi:MAG: gliding motility-associated C-terminal domain-containing protein [Chitinophagaceae bacterium]|nr:gliding motility-associated C-terminal domain-containing protein [Chitinophagaceae bacterium]
MLKINVPGYRSYTWNTGAGNAVVEIRDPGIYSLTVTDFNNCTGSDSIILYETNCIPTGIPNAFTPNNDGKNDHFRPGLNVEVTGYLLQVFNRNGQLVFQSKEVGKGWDGRYKNQQLDPGTYVYVVKFRDREGKLYTFNGNISLIR